MKIPTFKSPPPKFALIGAAAAAGVAGLAVVTQPSTESGERRNGAGEEICIKGDIGFAGFDAGCYSHDEIAGMADAPLADGQGGAASVSLTHPTDAAAAPAEAATCRDYREARGKGWYALTSRDMRREGFFIRACGALAMLERAQQAEHSYFANGSPEPEDIAGIAATLTFGEAAADPADLRVEKGQDHVWRIAGDAVSIAIHELANADFDNDGVEEVLAFAAASPQGGTASFYEAGLLEKDAPGAAVVFTPLDFDAAETGPEG